MKSKKNKNTGILVIILIGLLILAYKVMFVSPDVDLTTEENEIATIRIERLLNQLENANFDTSVLQDGKFQSLKSIEIPMISLPIGRENPFSDVF